MGLLYNSMVIVVYINIVYLLFVEGLDFMLSIFIKIVNDLIIEGGNFNRW